MLLALVCVSFRPVPSRAKMSITIDQLLADDQAKSSPVVETLSKWLDMHTTNANSYCAADLAELSAATGLASPDLDAWLAFTKKLREKVCTFGVSTRCHCKNVPGPKFTLVLNFALCVLARRSRASRPCFPAGYFSPIGFSHVIDSIVLACDVGVISTVVCPSCNCSKPPAKTWPCQACQRAV